MPIIKADHDEIADVLYLTTAEISQTTRAEYETGLLLHYDPETDEPVGATFLDYKKCWGPREEELIRRVAMFFRVTAADAKRALSQR